MCGIAGILDLKGRPVEPALPLRMGAALAHRGPDGEGLHCDGPVGLAHRRLAIIDLSDAAAQPMRSADGRHVIVYNGEVYNFRELRHELEDAGERFVSASDTEVVLAAYRAWGGRCVERLNGMFAFAIWDRAEHSLFLARDRYGIKPLYWTIAGGALLFASEHKAFLDHPEFRRDLDPEALLEYFTFQNLFTDRTLFAGVRLFPPGSRATIRPGDAGLRPERWWDFSFREPDRPAREEEYLEELDRLFRQAVARQTVSDVEIGAYLSGGIDSGSITALLAATHPGIKTFTCGFDLHSISGLEVTFDERERAEHLSYLFGTEHYEVVLKAGDMERVLPRLVWHLEEPRVGQCYPNYYVAGLASRFLKVVLAGTGGDEIFAGYPWRYYRTVGSADFESFIDTYYLFWKRLASNRELQAIFRPIAHRVAGVWTRDIFRDVIPPPLRRLRRAEDAINHSLYFEAKTFLHGLLVVEDKISMAHHLEVRVPFLDNDLVDFAMQIPAALKLRNPREVVRIDENEPAKERKHFAQTSDGKLLLRRMLERHIPAEIARAPKQGFSAPDASWFRGRSIDYVRSVIFDPRARIYEYFDHPSVCALVGEHLAGTVNRRLFVWSLLCFEWWLRTYLP